MSEIDDVALAEPDSGLSTGAAFLVNAIQNARISELQAAFRAMGWAIGFHFAEDGDGDLAARTRRRWVVESRESGDDWMPCSSSSASPEEAEFKRAGVLKRSPSLETRIVCETTTWSLEAAGE